MAEKKNMLYDFSLVKPGQNIVEVFPDLSFYKEFNNPIPHLSLLKVCTYVSNLVDKGSDLFNIRDYFQKAEKALDVAGFERDKTGSWGKIYLNIISGKNQHVNAIIAKYFELSASYDYETWITKKICLHQISAEMRKPLDAKSDNILADIEKKNKISIQLDAMKSDLMKLEERIFNDGRLREIIIAETSKNRNYYAEEYAMEGTVK